MHWIVALTWIGPSAGSIPGLPWASTSRRESPAIVLELAEADRREDDALDLGSDPASDRIRPLAELADHA
jgi:hypothetical protein